MNKIQVLDCTLRDGGYCNDWQFGERRVVKILKGLADSGIDIIECGFLTGMGGYVPGATKFTELSLLDEFLPPQRKGKQFVVMANYGEYDFERLPERGKTKIDGIRIAFHKKDIVAALDACGTIKEKGYKLFMQPMVSLCYSDLEFLDLVRRANEINPYAFYIVDSFGEMKRRDLIRLFYVAEHNLAGGIQIGFHSHNNMQLAFSNAQALVEMQTARSLIIDSSVYGMGRGAGNLNSELLVEYLNEFRAGTYDMKPLLHIIDEVLDTLYRKNPWGYSLPNYISALHFVHPNYASYLDNKKTLTVESMNEIFLRMDESKKYDYDKSYIESLYVAYMTTGKTQEAHKSELEAALRGSTVLLIAPGKSVEREKEKIMAFAKNENVVTMGVNFDYPYVETDYVFISNMRRFREYPAEKRDKCITTENIRADDVYLQTKYRDLLNDVEAVRDNAGLMAIKFLMNYGVKKIVLAGLDGYSHDETENHVNEIEDFITNTLRLDAINRGMETVLAEYGRTIDMEFLTMQTYKKFCRK